MNKKVGNFLFVIACLSYIPLAGIPIGIIVVIWGLLTRKEGGKPLAITGGGGILFSLTIYAAIHFFVVNSQSFKEMHAKLIEQNLATLVQAIEFYKLQNGNYPNSLEILQESMSKDTSAIVFDLEESGPTGKSNVYYYKLVDNTRYYLLALGTDGMPFSNDDITPKIAITQDSKIGLITTETPHSK